MAEKTIIIGATGGIGRELAAELSAKGKSLHLVARKEEGLAELASELSASFSNCDASDFSALENDLKQLVEAGDEVTSIANCAGSVLLKPAHLTSEEEFLKIISENLKTAFSVVRASTKIMKSGSILLFSTAAVRIGLPNHEAIAAAKGGVEGLVRSAASSYASKGIRVNAVAPGLTRTPMTERITNNEQALKKSESMHALGRIGEPKEIVSAACWLLDPVQSWVTGQILAVDGGLSTIVSK